MGREDLSSLKATLEECLSQLTSSQFQELKILWLNPKQRDELSGPSKADFVESVERWNLLEKALKEIRSKWPNLCPAEREKGEADKEDRTITLPFVNREAERKHISDSFATGGHALYWIIDAPAGYGKTALLHNIEESHRREGWLCCYIEIPREKEAGVKQIASWIAERFGCAQHFYPQGGMQPEEIGRLIAGCFLEIVKGRGEFLRVTLLLDNVETLTKTALADLGNFIEGIYLGLDETGFLEKWQWAVFLAGRGIHKEMFSRIEMKELRLSPFEFQAVQETIARCAREDGVSLKREVSSGIAADLMYLTGGHPKYMAGIVESLRKGNFAKRPNLQREEPEKYLREVLSVVDKIREVFPQELWETWEAISVFRRYDLKLLDFLLDEHLIPWRGEGRQLEEALVGRHLVKWKEGFWQDAIARRLAFLWLITKDFPRFRDLSQAGVRFYQKYLCSSSRRSEILAVEWLYQEIQYTYYVQKVDGRALEEAMLNVLEKIVKCLRTKTKEEKYSQTWVRDFLEVLRRDWELEFMFNYFAWEPRVRTKSDIHWSAPKFYGKDEAPYKRLQKRIEDVLEKLW